MDDFNQVNQIVSDAIKDSSYITVLISSGVYILYTLIIRLVDLFKAKDRNKPLIQMASAIKEVSENVVKLNTVLDKQIQDAESKELTKVRQVISLTFDSFRANISKTCNEIIIHNNIEENRKILAELVQTLNELDNQNNLVVLLKISNLSDYFSQLAYVENLQAKLIEKTTFLAKLNETLNDSLNQSEELKKQYKDLEDLEYKEPSKEQILQDLKEAVNELKLVEEGKLIARPAKELLDELE